jgi:hypothetical protein
LTAARALARRPRRAGPTAFSARTSVKAFVNSLQSVEMSLLVLMVHLKLWTRPKHYPTARESGQPSFCATSLPVTFSFKPFPTGELLRAKIITARSW